MRGALNHPILPDIAVVLSVLVMLALAGLATLPQDLHSMSHRKAAAIELLAQARDLVDEEAALLSVLAVASGDDNRQQLRLALTDTDRRFDQICVAVTAILPEVSSQIDEMARQFALLSKGALPGQSPDILADLRSHLQLLQHSLHSSDRALALGPLDSLFFRLWDRLV